MEQKSQVRSRLTELGADFAPSRLTTTISTGLVLALVNSLLALALASLIFSGPAAVSLPVGIGFVLTTSAVIGVILALGSSLPGMFGGIQDAPAAILGLSAASMVSVLAISGSVDTVIVLMAGTSLATGILLLLMGYLGLGEIARFVPVPVIGGLLAGTGYLILVAGVDILGGVTPSVITETGSVGRFWPGVVLAVLFLIASQRRWPSWTYLVFLLGSIVGFHVVIAIAGVDRAEALANGWLLGPFPEGSLLPTSMIDALAGADWAAIGGELASVVTILIIVPITLLMYISAIEVETRRDLRMVDELRATGWGNLAAALVGGPPGYLYLGPTVITHNLVGSRRGSAVIASLGVLGVVLAGGAILEWVPQFLIGGLLAFVGMSFMLEWLWESRRRMATLDYLLLIAIAVVVAFVGFIPGVAVGLGAAVLLFVIRYSRVDVVKHAVSSAEMQSNIERAPAEIEHLIRQGKSVLILELQGYIFFGTASRVLGRLQTHLESSEGTRFVVCDFRLVTGVDSSAVIVFERVAIVARDNGIVLLLSGLGNMTAQFAELSREYPEVVRVDPDLDHALAWCEERLLADAPQATGRQALPDLLMERLAPYLTESTIAPGVELMRQGEPSAGVYFLVSGRVTVSVEGIEGEEVRLRTVLPGTALGEISLYTGEACTATAVTETECLVHHLTPDAFDSIRIDDPAVAAELHFFVARMLAGRVDHANRAIRALQS
ncbi:MAG TPA: cyclic nucleotide-binding domain-containing protein [Acidimicrobiia bacterium]|nr:cyclic nucleotide-binding domain-containing protein [Acidimicrobiia bacterium]